MGIGVVEVFSLGFGFCIGSFLNVAIRRGYRGESLFGRSKCESCGRTLSWRDLIPVASFFLLRGKCRYCGSAFSLQYPLVEAATGILFAIAAYLFPLDINLWRPNLHTIIISFVPLILACVGLSAALFAFVVDLRTKIIPDSAFYILFAVGVAAVSFRWYAADPNFSSGIFSDAGAALLISLFFASLWFFSRGQWMGFGDAKLILATSLAIGFPASIAALLFSFWSGGVVGGVLLLFRRTTLKSTIPFGPFILLGSASAYFFSPFFFETTRFLEGIYEIVYYSF